MEILLKLKKNSLLIKLVLSKERMTPPQKLPRKPLPPLTSPLRKNSLATGSMPERQLTVISPNNSLRPLKRGKPTIRKSTLKPRNYLKPTLKLLPSSKLMKMLRMRNLQKLRNSRQNNYQTLVPRLLKLLKRNSMKNKLPQLPLLSPKKPPIRLLLQLPISKLLLNILEFKDLKENNG